MKTFLATLILVLLTVTAAIAGTAALTWTPVTAWPTTETDTGYNIFYGTTSGNLSTVVSVKGGATGTYVITGIPDDGLTKYFAITTWQHWTESAKSAEVSKLFPIIPLILNPPTNLIVK